MLFFAEINLPVNAAVQVPVVKLRRELPFVKINWSKVMPEFPPRQTPLKDYF